MTGALTVGVVVDQVEAGLVVEGGQMRLSNTQANAVGETLTERTGGDLNTIGVANLGVTRGQGADLTESLQVVK